MIAPTAWAHGGLPAGLSLVALQEDGTWGVVVVARDHGPPQLVATQGEPRTPDYCRREGRVAYVSPQGDVREVTLASGEDRLVEARDAQSAYTQPVYAPDCASLFVVVLAQGSSQDTNIARISLATGKRELVVAQRSAQFDPHPTAQGTLYYGSVACVVHCGRIIKELWVKHLVTGVAEQLSLHNAISQQPVLAPNGVLYYASDRNGSYDIWSWTQSGGAHPVTSGPAADVSPALDRDGRLYFLRYGPEGTALVRSHEGREENVSLPFAHDGLRDLRIDVDGFDQEATE